MVVVVAVVGSAWQVRCELQGQGLTISGSDPWRDAGERNGDDNAHDKPVPAVRATAARKSVCDSVRVCVCVCVCVCV
jgi:hypothetical protein